MTLKVVSNAAWIAGMLLCCAAVPAHSQDPTGLFAMGINAYENSADKCPYEPIVGETLRELDQHLSRMEPWRWENAKRQADGASGILGNFLDITRSQKGAALDQCADYAFMIRDTLSFAMLFVGQKPDLARAIARLNRMAETGQVILPGN
jgi:hypothetical protein